MSWQETQEKRDLHISGFTDPAGGLCDCGSDQTLSARRPFTPWTAAWTEVLLSNARDGLMENKHGGSDAVDGEDGCACIGDYCSPRRHGVKV